MELFQLVTVLSENICTNATNDLGKSGESSSQRLDVQTFATFSDKHYFPAFKRSSYQIYATTFLSPPFEVACSPRFSTSQFASSASQPFFSGTNYSHMSSLSLLSSLPASKSFFFKYLSGVFSCHLTARCHGFQLASNFSMTKILQ